MKFEEFRKLCDLLIVYHYSEHSFQTRKALNMFIPSVCLSVCLSVLFETKIWSTFLSSFKESAERISVKKLCSAPRSMSFLYLSLSLFEERLGIIFYFRSTKNQMERRPWNQFAALAGRS